MSILSFQHQIVYFLFSVLGVIKSKSNKKNIQISNYQHDHSKKKITTMTIGHQHNNNNNNNIYLKSSIQTCSID